MVPKTRPGFLPNTHSYAQPRKHPQQAVEGDLTGFASDYRCRETHRMGDE